MATAGANTAAISMESLVSPISNSPTGSSRPRSVVQIDDSSDEAAAKEPLVSTEAVADSSAPEDSKTPVISNNAAVGSQGHKEKSLGSQPEPQRLPRNRTGLLLAVGTDFLLLLLSTCFFVYAFVVLGYNGQPVDGHQKANGSLLHAARLGSTAFPILFAAVLGRLIKHVMAWRLENGERLGLLDLLAGSTTVSSTITTQFQLGVPTMMGAALVVLWAFSPLGGQASLRVLGSKASINTSTVSAKYMSSDYTYSRYFSAAPDESVLGLFNAALLDPQQVKKSARDTWGNVKIPMIERLATDDTSPATGGWLSVPDNDSIVYSSLVGLPLSDLPTGTNNTLYVETSYMTLDCPRLSNTVEPSDLDISKDSGTEVSSNTSSWWGAAATSNFFLTNSTGHGDCRRGPENDTLAPRFVAYSSWGPQGSRFGALCSLRTSYVEVEVSCIGQTCRSSKMRNSTLPNPVPTWTLFDYSYHQAMGIDCRWFYYYMNLFFASSPIPQSGYSTALQGYLLDPYSPAARLTIGKISDMDRATFAVRLAQQLNSLMLLCAGPFVVPYGLARDPVGENANPSKTVSTTARSVRTFWIMVCHIQWLVVLLISSMILMVASVGSIVLRCRRVTPELSLNWSTVIRDSPYVPMASTGSFLDDSDRSIRMRDTRLMFGDGPSTEHEHGHLAIRSTAHDEVERARKNRFYG